jgi:hypothetical protein
LAEQFSKKRSHLLSLIAFGSGDLRETWNDYTQFAFAAKR